MVRGRVCYLPFQWPGGKEKITLWMLFLHDIKTERKLRQFFSCSRISHPWFIATTLLD